MGFLLAVVSSAPAHATSQCPPEFGPKDPLVNVLGWAVVAVGIVVGGLLFAYVVRWSRGMRWLRRSAILAAGLVGMVLVWIVGLVVAIRSFFLQC